MVLLHSLQAGFPIFFHQLFIELKQIPSLIFRAVDPGKMVEPQHIGLDHPAVHRDTAEFLKGICQYFLCSEHLMAAAKRLYLGKSLIKDPGAQCHGIGVVDYPGIGAVFPDLICKSLIHGQHAHGPEQAARSHGIPHRLIDPILFRCMYV